MKKKKEEKKEAKKVKSVKREQKRKIEKEIPKNKEVPKEKEAKKQVFIYGQTPIGDENENEKINQTPGGTPEGEEPTPNPTPEETPEEENNEEIELIPNELDFSTRIDLLIKGLNVNLNSPLNEKIHDYISLAINGIEIQIKLTIFFGIIHKFNF